MIFKMFSVPARAKLVDDADVKKLNELIEQRKREYKPEQGCLLDDSNSVKRVA